MLQFLLPSQCALCHAWPAQRLCAACLARFMRQQPRCARCACLLPAGLDHCADCMRQPPPLQACHAVLDYAYPWADVISAFKFRADPGWAIPLAGLLRASPGTQPALQAAQLVLPIPLSRQRLRQRGYNQALLLARRLGAGRKLQPGLLLRLQDSAAQSSLPRAARLQNLRAAFAIDPLAANQVAGQRVLLVDDVMTTGATLHAAALTLLAAGAASVAALVLARTPANSIGSQTT